MLGRGCGVGITQASKDAEIAVVWRRTVEEFERRDQLAWATRAAIDEERRGGESLGPVHSRHVCVKEKSACCFVEGA